MATYFIPDEGPNRSPPAMKPMRSATFISNRASPSPEPRGPVERSPSFSATTSPFSNSPRQTRSRLGAEVRSASISSQSLDCSAAVSASSSSGDVALLKKSVSVAELGSPARPPPRKNSVSQFDHPGRARLPSALSIPGSLQSVFNERIDFHPAEMDVSGALLPIGFTLSVFEVEFTRQFKKPKVFFVRLDICRQTCRGATAVSHSSTPAKVFWPEEKFQFDAPGLSNDSLTITLRTITEDSKEKVYGKAVLPFEALGCAATHAVPLNRDRGKKKKSSKTVIIGKLLMFVQPYVSTFLQGFEHFSPVDGPDFSFQKPAGGAELFSFCTTVKALSSERAFGILTNDTYIDPLFQLTFFLFFLDIGSFEKFIDELDAVFQQAANSPKKLERQGRIVALLETFLRQYYHIFFFIPNPGEELELLRDFIRITLNLNFEAQSRQLLLMCKHIGQMVADRKAEGPCGSLDQNPTYQWSLTAKTENHLPTLSLAQLDPDVFAEQLTVLEAQIFRAIQPHEFARWHYDDHTVNSPSLDYLTRHFNNISRWIQTEISFQTRLQERSEILRRSMLIAISLAKLNNYNGLMEILSAINSSAIRRMNRTFQCIDKPLLARFNRTSAIMAHEGNFRTYRKQLQSLPKGTPAIPYVGVFLTDLRFIMDGCPTRQNVDVDGDSRPVINWHKFAKATEVIASLVRMQDDCIFSAIGPNPQFQDWVLSQRIATAEECYQMSRRVDPADYEKLVEELMLQEKKLKDRIAALENGCSGPRSAPLDDATSENSEFSVDDTSFDRFYGREDQPRDPSPSIDRGSSPLCSSPSPSSLSQTSEKSASSPPHPRRGTLGGASPSTPLPSTPPAPPSLPPVSAASTSSPSTASPRPPFLPPVSSSPPATQAQASPPPPASPTPVYAPTAQSPLVRGLSSSSLTRGVIKKVPSRLEPPRLPTSSQDSWSFIPE